MWAKVATVLSIVIGLGIVHQVIKPGEEQPLGHIAQQHALAKRTAQEHALRTGAPFYRDTVLPNGDCKIDPADNLPLAYPDTEFPGVIPFAINPHYGGHIVVRGRDGKLYHKYQRTPGVSGNWTDWKCLTPDLTKVPCSAAPKCRGYDNNPVIALQPHDGTLVVFVRQMDDLDIHEMHLTDPKDPESWCPMRAPTCLCNFPPCVNLNQTKCGTGANCDNKGVDCRDEHHKPTSTQYWGWQPAFPTSELSVLADTEGKLNLYYRGFDGAMYVTKQHTAGDALSKYDSPVMFGTNAVVE